MWGRIILRSSQSSGGLESATAKAAILDECGQDDFTLETWEAIQRRLSLSQGRVCGATTLYNLGWLKQEIYDAWTDGDPDITLAQFASYINPAFPRAEYERMENKMQGWRFAMFYRGEYARPASLIYGDFTDSMLVDPFVIPNDWPRVVGVDFGGANTATLWLAQDPDTERWFVYHENLSGGLTSGEHASKALSQAAGCTDVTAVGGASSETQNRMDWGAGGFYIEEPPISGVEPGIDRLTTLIKEDRFRFFRTLKGFRDEIGSYQRKMDSMGNPTDEILDKRSFHRLDAARYAAARIASRRGWVLA